MNQPQTYPIPIVPEETEETPEIPALPRTEIRRRLEFGASRLVVDPRGVESAWMAPLPGPASVGEA